MKIRLSDYEVTMNSGRTYSLAELVTPKNSDGQRKYYDVLAVAFTGTVDSDGNYIDFHPLELVGFTYGADLMTPQEMWDFLIEEAEADDKRREQEGR